MQSCGELMEFMIIEYGVSGTTSPCTLVIWDEPFPSRGLGQSQGLGQCAYAAGT